MIAEQLSVTYECIAESIEIEEESQTVYGVKRKSAEDEISFHALSTKKHAVLEFISLLEDYGSDKRTFRYLVEDFLS